MNARVTQRGLAFLTAIGVGLALAACSSAAGGTGSPTVTSKTADPAIEALIPKQFKGKPFVMAQIGNFPPYDFTTSSGALVGFMPDLSRAIVALTGLQGEYPIQPNALSAIAGVEAGKWAAHMAGFNVTKAREQVVDQISMFEDSDGFLEQSSSKPVSSDPTSLCGVKVALIASDPSVQYIQQLSKQYCTSKGKPAVQSVLLPDAPSTLLALKSGRVQLACQVVSYLGYEAKLSGGTLRVTGPKFAPTLVSILTQKGNGLARLYQAAVNVLIKNGTYGRILAKYGVSAGAVPSAEINPPPLPMSF
jgi:polar amino acid transport system substrate-binding protein